MRSAIIIPPSMFLDDYKVFPQLGPYYIKRYVEEHSQHKVDILDELVDDVSKWDVIGYSVTTPQFFSALKHATQIQKYNKTLVIGGPHCKNYPVEGPWNFVVKYDGCKPFLNILNGREPGHELDDIDQLPYRDESLHTYQYFLDGRKTTVIMTSRGCPNHCAFCEDAGTKVRLKSTVAVDKEIQECVNLGFTGIMFFDDLFCLNLRRVKELCSVIKKYNLKFRCFAHARNFSQEMAEILADAGCVEIGYGAEHISQDILDIVEKRTTTEQNYNLIKIAHRYEIRVKAFLLLGLPGESNKTAADLEQFVLNSGVDDYDVGIYFPYKGTKLADQIDKYDLQLLDGNPLGYYKGKCGYAECVTRTKNLSREELMAWRERIYSHNKRWKSQNSSK